MNRSLIPFFFLQVCFFSCGFAEDYIVGKWIEENLPASELIEFPNLIQFDSTGQYIIFNDAYDDSIDEPIVETGKYRVSGDTIFFHERKSHINFRPYGEEEKTSVLIIEKEKEYLEVNFKSYYFRLRKLKDKENE